MKWCRLWLLVVLSMKPMNTTLPLNCLWRKSKGRCLWPSLLMTLGSSGVGAESDQQVNICSFAVHCDRRWPSTQWHRVYTGLGNVPYVQSGSVGDFISEPRCSKFTVGLQMRRRKMRCIRGSVGSDRKGQEWQELRCELEVWTWRFCGCELSI